MITSALYTKLSSDTTLTGKLSTYNTKPSVFTVDPAPGDATLPYIVISYPVITPYDTKNTVGRTVWCDVRCYAEADGSAVTVESIAERVRILLHRQSLSGTGFTTIWSECDGPVNADDGSSYGRIVTLKITIEEN